MQFQEITQKVLDTCMLYSKANTKNGYKQWDATAYAQGFVGDIGDLMKLIMMHDGYRKSKPELKDKMAHELGDCLWALIAISHSLEIDLEEAFITTMTELEERFESGQ